MGDNNSWNRVGDKWRGTEGERKVGFTKELEPLYLSLEVRKQQLSDLTQKIFMKI